MKNTFKIIIISFFLFSICVFCQDARYLNLYFLNGKVAYMNRDTP